MVGDTRNRSQSSRLKGSVGVKMDVRVLAKVNEAQDGTAFQWGTEVVGKETEVKFFLSYSLCPHGGRKGKSAQVHHQKHQNTDQG